MTPANGGKNVHHPMPLMLVLCRYWEIRADERLIPYGASDAHKYNDNVRPVDHYPLTSKWGKSLHIYKRTLSLHTLLSHHKA